MLLADLKQDESESYIYTLMRLMVESPCGKIADQYSEAKYALATWPSMQEGNVSSPPQYLFDDVANLKDAYAACLATYEDLLDAYR